MPLGKKQAPPMSTKDQLRGQQKAIRGAQRQLTRDQQQLERQEKQLVSMQMINVCMRAEKSVTVLYF